MILPKFKMFYRSHNTIFFGHFVLVATFAFHALIVTNVRFLVQYHPYIVNSLIVLPSRERALRGRAWRLAQRGDGAARRQPQLGGVGRLRATSRRHPANRA